ncbi:hypothetical protein [Aeoliella sp.]|uniref:hypothetical protein n=1 Tax=Aeoliella sp. TaxID=2795800 RepID=UPI003CCB8D63
MKTDTAVLQTGIVFLSLATSVASAFEPCRINIVDKDTGWPVPLVELRTTHNVRFASDNAGVVAFDLPELMDTETWLFVEGHGYSVPADGFGMRGVRVTPSEGATLTIEVTRELPGKRLGRVSGAGLFGEAQRFGEFSQWREQGIVGCDSVQYTEHNGRAYWGWGDTSIARYPLGLFDMLSATTELTPLSRFEPPIELKYDYFKDDEGRPRSVADMPGDGPTWLSGYTSVKDKQGVAHLVATYDKIRAPLTTYEQGLCEWNEETKQFDHVETLWSRTSNQEQVPDAPMGHVTRWTDEAGKRWMLFGDPFPTMKCHDSYEAWRDPQQWQFLKPQEHIETADGSASIKHHRGSIAYNAYRDKWVSVFTQMGGESSPLGEIWYAEADQPTGPWRAAQKVVTHNNYTFYNPRLHHEWAEEGSPILLFEATYTATFANNARPTGRHDYNQVLYRLDLNEFTGE